MGFHGLDPWRERGREKPRGKICEVEVMEVVMVGGCGSVDLGYTGKQSPHKISQEKVKEGDTWLNQRHHHNLSVMKFKVHKRKVLKVKETWEFNSDESISHVMKLSWKSAGMWLAQRGTQREELGWGMRGRRWEAVCCTRTTGWRWASPTISDLMGGSWGSYVMTTPKDLPKIT